MSHPVADYLYDIHRSFGVGVPGDLWLSRVAESAGKTITI